MKTSLITLALATLALAGCSDASVFACESNEACKSGGEGAQCEASGWCSFPDETCPDGRRYGDLVGDGFNGLCVDQAGETNGGSGGTSTTSTTSTVTTLDPSDSSDDTSTSTTSSTSTTTSTSATTGPDDGGIPFGPWWDCSWRARKALTVSGLDDLALTDPVGDMVVLVALNGSRVDYEKLRADGGDLRFIGDDHETEFPYEVEEWDPDGVSSVWVRVPSVAEGTQFFMYYDGPDEDAGYESFEVWPDHYGGVWHATGGGVDSTQYANDAFGDVTLVDGHVAGGVDPIGPEGLEEYTVLPADGVNQVFAGRGTVSAWVRLSAYNTITPAVIIGKSAESNGDGGWLFAVTPDNQLRFIRGFTQSRVEWAAPVGAVPLLSWTHVAAIYDDSQGTSGDAVLIVNGVEVAVDQSNGNFSGVPDDDTDRELLIGDRLQGRFDEARVRTGGNVTEAIVDYRSQADMLLQYGGLDASGCFTNPG